MMEWWNGKNWNNGTVEYWNNGGFEELVEEIIFFVTQSSIIP